MSNFQSSYDLSNPFNQYRNLQSTTYQSKAQPFSPQTNPLETVQKQLTSKGMKKVFVEPDQPSGGGATWFCSVMYRDSIISRREFAKLKLAFLKVFYHYPAFMRWYLLNGRIIRDEAFQKGFDWKELRVSMTEVFEADRKKDFHLAVKHYIDLCRMMSDRFGSKADAFDAKFYERRGDGAYQH